MSTTSSEDTGSQNLQLQHVAVKPPVFMEANAVAWFSIMEAQFNLSKVTVSVTKFYHVLAALPAEIVGKIPQSVLDSYDYVKLKEAVISAYERTKPEMLDKLMASTCISGRPSVYLNELMSLASRIGVGDDIVRHKFIQALPQSVSLVVASQKQLDLDSLGKLADELLPYFAKNMSIQQVSSQTFDNRTTSDNGSAKCGSGQIPIGIRPYSKKQRPKVCRSHLYFAERARYCKPWCKWPGKTGCTIQPSSRSSSPARVNTAEN